MSVSQKQALCFIDSNIWLYTLLSSDNEEEKRKSILAKNIIKTQNIVISTQIINEVSVNLIKKAQIDEKQLSNLINSFYKKYEIIEFSRDILLKSSRLRQQYNLSFWDSLIVSSALSVKANYLYSEDMQNGLIIHQNLKIINLFLEESDAAEY